MNGHNDNSKHQTNHYHDGNGNNETNPCIYKCTVCRELVGSGEELLQHVRTHTRMISHPYSHDSKVS